MSPSMIASIPRSRFASIFPFMLASIFPFMLASIFALMLAAACGLSTTGSGENVGTGVGGSGNGNGGGEGGAGGTSGVDPSDGGVVVLDSGLGPIEGGSNDPYSRRVTSGLVALYELEENAGSTVADTAAAPYDLQIATLGSVTWHPHYLALTDYTRLANGGNFQKLVDACTAARTR